MYVKAVTDNDLYKLTMQKAVLDCFAGTWVEYDFINRNIYNQFTNPVHDIIRQQIDAMADLRLGSDEYGFLNSRCPFLGEPYLKWLKDYRFDPSEVVTSIVNNQLKLKIKGTWERTILWEVPLMAIISEAYFNDPLSPGYEQRTLEKGERLAENNVIFTDFGTRRRRSFLTQDTVVKTLSRFKGFMGTSNVWLAKEHSTRPLGTMAHEWIMGVSALEGLRHANRYAMKHWSESYKGNLGTALPDTFGTEAFWGDFDNYYARLFDSIRHDSGDPIKFGDSAIAHYKKLGINPMHKFLLFSDGLTVDKAIEIKNYFEGKTNTSFGIGTHFTNDVPGSKALNMVIKLVMCGGVPVVKLSDTPSKAIGNRDALRVAKWTFFNEALDA